MQFYAIPTYDGEGHNLAMPTPTGEWVKREDVEKLEERVQELVAAILIHKMAFGPAGRTYADHALWNILKKEED